MRAICGFVCAPWQMIDGTVSQMLIANECTNPWVQQTVVNYLDRFARLIYVVGWEFHIVICLSRCFFVHVFSFKSLSACLLIVDQSSQFAPYQSG